MLMWTFYFLKDSPLVYKRLYSVRFTCKQTRNLCIGLYKYIVVVKKQLRSWLWEINKVIQKIKERVRYVKTIVGWVLNPSFRTSPKFNLDILFWKNQRVSTKVILESIPYPIEHNFVKEQEPSSFLDEALGRLY